MATYTSNGTVNDGSNASIKSIHDNLVDGSTGQDIITIPAQPCHWTETLTLTKVCTLRGAGQDGSGNWLTTVFDDCSNRGSTVTGSTQINSATITATSGSPNWTPNHVGLRITISAGFATGTNFIGSYISPTSVTISSSGASNVPKLATSSQTGVTITTIDVTVFLLQGRMAAGWRPAHSLPMRVTGIRFARGLRTAFAQNGATPSDPYTSGGVINFAGHDQRTDSQFRLDHCFWDNLNGSFVTDTITGVVDNCIIIPPPDTDFIYPKQSWWQTAGSVVTNYNSPPQKLTDGSMADGIDWGSDKFVYIENSLVVRQEAGTFHGGVTDSFGGSRMVWRDNVIVQGSVNSHGTETGGARARGIRALEVYRNNFVSLNTTGQILLVVMRAGTGTIWGNTSNVAAAVAAYPQLTGTVFAYTGSSKIQFAAYRHWTNIANTGYQSADGQNDFDKNSGPYTAGTMSGTPTPNQNGSTFTVATSTGSGAGLPWTAGRWAGYTLVNTGALASGRIVKWATQKQHWALIDNSGTNTLTLHAPFSSSQPGVDFINATETYAIYKVDHALDQPGYGQGDVWSPSSNPVTIAGNVPGWANNGQNQVNERSYVWNNAPPMVYVAGSYLQVGPGDAGSIADVGTQRPLYTPLGVHPLVGPPVPTITSPGYTFSNDAASQTFPIQTANFTHTPGIVITSFISVPAGATANQLPLNVSINGVGVLSGSALNAVVGDYKFNLKAQNDADLPLVEIATGVFTLTIETPHTGPTVTLTTPAQGQTFFAPANITLTANAQAGTSPIAKVEFFQGATLIPPAITNPPYSLVWQAVDVGNYSITAKVTDTFNPAGTATSTPAVGITVQNPTSNLVAPTIVVTAGIVTAAITFLVDSVSGNDTNSGSTAAPWKTIQKAMNSATPGSIVGIKAGTYQERLTLNVSGTAGNPIIFQPIGYTGLSATGTPGGASIAANGYTTCVGDQVILDYAYLGTDTTSNTPLFNINNKSYVTVQGITFQNYTCDGTFKQLLRIDGGSNDIQFINNRFLHNKNIHGVQDNTSALLHIRIWNSNNIIVRGNELGDIVTCQSEALTMDTANCSGSIIESNYIHDTDGIAIDIHGGAHDAIIRGNLLEYISVKRADGTLWYGTGSIALYVDGGNTSVIEQNLVRNSAIGVEVLAEPGQPDAHHINVRNNVLYSNGAGGNGAILIGTWYSNVDGSTVHDINVLNNTIYNNNIGFYIRPYTSASVVWKNNILSGNTQNISNTLSWPVGTMDYNLYFGGTAGADAHKVTTNPLFTNTSSIPPNLSLQATSPAKNAGDTAFTAATGETDFLGNTRVFGGRVDMGAYEIQS